MLVLQCEDIWYSVLETQLAGRVRNLNRKELSCSASEFNTRHSQYIHSPLFETLGPNVSDLRLVLDFSKS